MNNKKKKKKTNRGKEKIVLVKLKNLHLVQINIILRKTKDLL